MKYSELVDSIVTNVLESCGISEEVIKAGKDKYNIDSLDKKVDRAEFAKKLEAQNQKIDNETEEERANRNAQFKRAHAA